MSHSTHRPDDIVRAKLHAMLSTILEGKGLVFVHERPLRDQGFDSLDTIVLLSGLESSFALNIEDADLVDAHFQDLDSLTCFVTRKRAASDAINTRGTVE
jgi:hypothetical protein